MAFTNDFDMMEWERQQDADMLGMAGTAMRLNTTAMINARKSLAAGGSIEEVTSSFRAL